MKSKMKSEPRAGGKKTQAQGKWVVWILTLNPALGGTVDPQPALARTGPRGGVDTPPSLGQAQVDEHSVRHSVPPPGFEQKDNTDTHLNFSHTLCVGRVDPQLQPQPDPGRRAV